MKVHSQEFKDTIAGLGRQQDVIITYTLDNEEITLTSEDINSATPVYEANLLKSVMKELELDSNIDIPLDTQINFKYGIYIESTGQYEYLDFGNYIVYSSEKQEDQYSYKIKCYDKMLYSMVEYEAMNITYPIAIREYLGAICTHLGIAFANSSDVFANYNKEIPYELYLNSDGNGMDYTFRDVLTEIAQATGSVICINNNDELEVRYPLETNDTIDEEYLKDTGVSFKEKYGPINSIVLSRSAESDNVYLRDEQSVTDNGLCEVKIADNQIMNFNDRSDYLQGILDSIGGIEYYTCDYTSTGICYYDLLDYYTVTVGEQNYKCLMLNDEIDITQGLEEHIHAEMPEETETDYEKADKTDRRINQAYIMVDKQNQKIEALAQQITDVTVGGESNNASVTITKVGPCEPVYLEVHPIMENISYLYPRNNLYPSDTLYMPGRSIYFNDDEFELPDDLLYYDANTYDEFIMDRNEEICKVIKRCKYNADGTVGILAEPIETTYPYPTILLEEGDYVVTIGGYNTGYINVSLLGKSVFSSQYTLKSVFEQTVEGINSEVSKKVGDNEIISKINQSAEEVAINASKIRLEGTVTANEKFKINLDGSIETTDLRLADGGSVIGGNGLYTNLQFVAGSMDGRNGYAYIGFNTSVDYDEGTGITHNAKSWSEMFVTIPNNFTIDRAVVTLIHNPLNFWSMTSAEDEEGQWFWGYSRNIGIYTADLDEYYMGYAGEYSTTTPSMTIIKNAFGENDTWQPSVANDTTHSNEIITSVDIKDRLEAGKTNRIIIASDDNPPERIDDFYQDQINCTKMTGRVYAIIDIFGYIKIAE